MKTILCPTDFSEIADNALLYAVEVARYLKMNLCIFHTYEIPYSTHTMSTTLLTIMKQEAEKHMLLCEKKLNKTAPDVDVQTSVQHGNTIRLIVEKSENINAELIIMGTKGASGFKEFFFGSNTASVVQHSSRPILTIPQNVTFSPFHKIVLASDLNIKNYENSVEYLKTFSKVFYADVLVLHVDNKNEESSKDENNLKLDGINHTFHTVKNNNLEDGINTFIKNNDCELLVVIARKHSLLDLLFLPARLSKRLVNHLDIPILILPKE